MTNEMEMIATGVVPAVVPAAEPEVPELLAESLDRLRKWATLDAVTDRPDMHRLMQDHHNDMDAILQAAGAQAEKMYSSLLKGRGGWWDPARCSPQGLLIQLIEHIEKGDMVDVMNFAMMLWFRADPETDSEREQWQKEIHAIATAWAEKKLDERTAFMDEVYRKTEEDLRAETEQLRSGDMGIAEGQPLNISHVIRAQEMLTSYIRSVQRQLDAALPEGASLLLTFGTHKSTGLAEVDIKLEVGH